MAIRLQVNEYIEKRNAVMEYVGKRFIHKDTGWVGTIINAQHTEAGDRYTVHFDHQPKKLLQVVWGAGLVVMGGVQSNGIIS